ncbi:MAG: sulfite exporter TauE/SafE family protein [Candidatus Gracilibacteria bacterium]|jgi:sulfite exporter TauE/SafE/plastocyanin domain-containing protein
MPKKNKIELKIEGMTCASCEVLIERKFHKIPGVSSVKVNQASGKAVVHFDGSEPSLQEFQNVVAADGYKIIADGIDNAGVKSKAQTRNTKRDYLEIGAILIIIFGLYILLKQANVFDFNLGISANMSYGFIFLIGLVAASSSCIAVTGGVLLSLAAKYNETYQPKTHLEKLKPHLLFNAGRIVSYTVLGGLLGGLGSFFTVSARVTGIVSIIASLFMILMGMRILKLFPGLHKYSPRLPKVISHKILKLENKQNKGLPFLMGGLTFFLPCGFTQSLQLYVISRGNFIDGALIMLFFALGTLPALLSLSAISSFAEGKFQRYFLKFSGVLVLILGLFNINNGLALAGFNASAVTSFFRGNNNGVQSQTDSIKTGTAQSNAVKIENGKQIVEMNVKGYTYTPSQFTIVKGVPVEWRVYNAGAAGCGQVLTVPSLGLTELLPRDNTKIINFTPDSVGQISFNCTMGMMTPGIFNVIENTNQSNSQNAIVLNTGTPKIFEAETQPYDPAADNSSVQKITVTVTADRGFDPPVTTIKKGIPVELTVDDQVDLGGCMGTMVIPEFGVAKLLKIGKNIINFTPTQTGTVDAVCSMGILQTSFNVVD